MHSTPLTTRLACLVLALAGLVLLPACQSAQQKAREQGVSLYQQGNYPAALTQFKQALSYDEFSAVDNYYAGMAAFRDSKFDQAAFHLKLAWSADPSLPEIKQALVETLVRQGKPGLALDYLDRDTKLVEKTRDHRVERTVNKRKYLWEKEDRMFAEKADNRAYVAETYARLGDLDNARVYFEEAVKMSPKNPLILKAYGDLYAKAGQKEVAQSLYTRAYAIDPATPGLVEAMTAVGLAISDIRK